MIRSLALCAALLLPGATLAADYVQAPGSTLTFATQYDGEAVAGRFPVFATRLHFDPAKPDGSRLDVVIPLVGTTIADKDRDTTLRSPDFLDVAKFPQARFTSTKFRALGGGRFAADGQLALRGVTRPVTLVFTWTPGAQPVLNGSATVKRLDFGIGGGDWAKPTLIPNEVRVNTKVVFAPAAK